MVLNPFKVKISTVGFTIRLHHNAFQPWPTLAEVRDLAASLFNSGKWHYLHLKSDSAIAPLNHLPNSSLLNALKSAFREKVHFPSPQAVVRKPSGQTERAN